MAPQSFLIDLGLPEKPVTDNDLRAEPREAADFPKKWVCATYRVSLDLRVEEEYLDFTK